MECSPSTHVASKIKYKKKKKKKKKKNLTAIEKAISASWEEKKATSKNKKYKTKKKIYSTI